jgi:DNA-binding NtrC family response regulator
LQKYAMRARREVKKISPEALRLLQEQSWPGNVRELENAMEYAVVFCTGDSITAHDLPFARTQLVRPGAYSDGAKPQPQVEALADLPYREAKERALNAFETAYFTAVLDRAGGNVSEAARQAGLDRSNFRRAARRAGVTTRGDGD